MYQGKQPWNKWANRAISGVEIITPSEPMCSCGCEEEVS